MRGGKITVNNKEAANLPPLLTAFFNQDIEPAATFERQFLAAPEMDFYQFGRWPNLDY